MIAAGKLRHRIRLEKPTGRTTNDYGERLPEGTAYEAVRTVWGNVEALRVREYFAAQENNNETSYRVTLRHQADIQPGWRLVWLIYGGERVLELTGPPLDRGGNRTQTECLCRERY